MGNAISCGLISRTRYKSAMVPGRAPGATRKWYMLCRAWWSSLRKVIMPLGVSKLIPSIVPISRAVFVSPAVFLRAVTSAMADEKPPAVKKSGGDFVLEIVVCHQPQIGLIAGKAEVIVG